MPGSQGRLESAEAAFALIETTGFPVMIKAAAGGGGKGMKKCDRAEDFSALWQSAKRESAGAFGDDRLYLEKFLEAPRHVEIQVFADERGETIWLGERECSIQRRHQKVIEETPSCVLDDRTRRAMGELEMNTRLQVEHPVTEATTGLDLVRMQLEVARGERILAQEQVVRRGHAIEARVYAEDPARSFLPSPGKITYLRVPAGPGIRDDSGVYGGWVVPPHYDPLISKLTAWAPTRDQAVARLVRALGEYTVHGITANIAWLGAVLAHPAFRSGDYDTGFCERYAEDLAVRPDADQEEVALVAAAVAAFKRDRDEADAFAARAGAAPRGSTWARLGRARALRGGAR